MLIDAATEGGDDNRAEPRRHAHRKEPRDNTEPRNQRLLTHTATSCQSAPPYRHLMPNRGYGHSNIHCVASSSRCRSTQLREGTS